MSEPDDDPDRSAILRRRQRFVRLALSGLAITGASAATACPCLTPRDPEPKTEAKTGEEKTDEQKTKTSEEKTGD